MADMRRAIVGDHSGGGGTPWWLNVICVRPLTVKTVTVTVTVTGTVTVTVVIAVVVVMRRHGDECPKATQPQRPVLTSPHLT